MIPAVDTGSTPTAPSAPPRWARAAAHAAALTPLPSALWRLSLVLGFSGGYTEAGRAALNIDGSGWIYLVALSVVTEAAALLTLGLLQPWGDAVPRWVPKIRGRPIPTKPVVWAASVGAGLLTLLWTQLLFWWAIPHPDMTATGVTVVGLLYLPLVAWGPLLAAVTVDYARRHRTA